MPLKFFKISFEKTEEGTTISLFIGKDSKLPSIGKIVGKISVIMSGSYLLIKGIDFFDLIDKLKTFGLSDFIDILIKAILS